MTARLDWLTNDPQAAVLFRTADATFEAARRAALKLPLAEKIVALRNARTARAKGYAAMFAGHVLYATHDECAAAARAVLGATLREGPDFITTELAPCTKPGREMPGGWIWESFAGARERVRRASRGEAKAEAAHHCRAERDVPLPPKSAGFKKFLERVS